MRNAKATREIADIDGGESEFVEIPPTVNSNRTMGAVGGLGFELIDDINLKLSVEAATCVGRPSPSRSNWPTRFATTWKSCSGYHFDGRPLLRTFGRARDWSASS